MASASALPPAAWLSALALAGGALLWARLQVVARRSQDKVMADNGVQTFLLFLRLLTEESAEACGWPMLKEAYEVTLKSYNRRYGAVLEVAFEGGLIMTVVAVSLQQGGNILLRDTNHRDVRNKIEGNGLTVYLTNLPEQDGSTFQSDLLFLDNKMYPDDETNPNGAFEGMVFYAIEFAHDD